MRHQTGFALLFFVAALAVPAGAGDWAKWVAPDETLSLHFPTGWVVSYDGGMVTGTSPSTREELRLIPVEDRPQATARSLAEGLLDAFGAAGVEELEVESWRETDDPDHVAAAEVSYSEDGVRHLGLLILSRQDDSAIAFTYTVRGDSYAPDRASVLLQGLIASLAEGEDSVDPALAIPPMQETSVSEAARGGTQGKVIYALPAGWTTAEQDGGALLMTPNAAEAADALIVLFPAAELGNQTFEAWFEASMATTIQPPARVLQPAQVEVNQRQGLDVLTAVRAIQDDGGAARLQLCHAISDGSRAVLVVGLAADDAAVERHGDALAAFLRSLDFAGRTPPTPLGRSAGENQGELLPEAGLVDGHPQGLFVGVSVLSGNPASLLFLDGGRCYHGIPDPGLNRLDWAQLQAEHGNLCSGWEMQGGTLRILWPNGNVWESPVEATATGMQFNGKQYGAVHPVDLRHLAGSWEGTKSTAWLNIGNGPSMTQINSLQVAADGSYTWGVATGGDVGNATTYSEAAFAGRVEIDGYEALFHANDGQTRRLSMARWTDPDTLILGGAFYFRK
jgi:hypothetical protein